MAKAVLTTAMTTLGKRTLSYATPLATTTIEESRPSYATGTTTTTMPTTTGAMTPMDIIMTTITVTMVQTMAGWP